MARPKREWEKVLIRFEPGTGEKVHSVLIEGETHAGFVKEAVAEKIARRARAKPKDADA